jgi:hypothetical protein
MPNWKECENNNRGLFYGNVCLRESVSPWNTSVGLSGLRVETRVSDFRILFRRANNLMRRVAQSVRVATGYWGFSFSLWVQTGSGTHPASCTMDTGAPFPGGKAWPGRDADHSPHLVPRSRMSRRYTSSPPKRDVRCECMMYQKVCCIHKCSLQATFALILILGMLTCCVITRTQEQKWKQPSPVDEPPLAITTDSCFPVI